MTISEIVRQGFYYARTCRSLWLFGFIVGLASGGSSGAGNGGGGGVAAGGGLAVEAGGLSGLDALGLRGVAIAAIIVCLLLLAIAGFVLRYLSEGALIEGVVRARQGGRMTVAEGFRAGWAHWGVLLRIALVYFAATVGAIVLLAAPCIIAAFTLGSVAAVMLGIPSAIIAVPVLVTLYLVQAFASRIAVIENRHAFDAIAKARLFLHGRLMLGLKLIVATLLGSIGIVLAAVAVLLPLVLLLVLPVRLMPALGVSPLIVLGVAVLVPVGYVLTAMLGTMRSSIWTIGYLTQRES